MIDIKDIEPFGYFKHTPFGWEDCSELDEDAVPLYELKTIAAAIDAARRANIRNEKT